MRLIITVYGTDYNNVTEEIVLKADEIILDDIVTNVDDNDSDLIA